MAAEIGRRRLMELGLAAAAVSAGGVLAKASARGYDIVDAQVHVGRGGIEPFLKRRRAEV